MVQIDADGKVDVLNRQGEQSQTELPAAIRTDLARLPRAEWVLDCELISGRALWVFDLPVGAGRATPTMHFGARYEILTALLHTWQPKSGINLLPLAVETTSKLQLAHGVLSANGEGIIAKRLDGQYMSGKRSHAMKKLKFYRDIDCVVTDMGREGKSNLGLGLLSSRGDMIDVGEVTSLAGDGPRVKVGDVVCVKYLYAVDPARPRLYQPTLPRLRDDKPADQCTLDQLEGSYRNLEVLTSW